MKKQRLLYIMMGTHNPDIQKGFEYFFECCHWDWTRVFVDKKIAPKFDQGGFGRHIPYHIRHLAQLKSEQAHVPLTNQNELLNQDLLDTFNEFKPDVVFIHTQSEGIIKEKVIKEMALKSKIVNWSGDVRKPTPKHYKDLGKLIDVTLFTNMSDVEELKSDGIKSDFLQVGFDSQFFSPKGPKVNVPEIVFMGTHYEKIFPLTSYRKYMVESLKEKYGDRFGVYGHHWGHLGNGFLDTYAMEGTVYRSCKIAISLSHFNLSRYASDRLFRILGSGAFCLSHRYKDIEKDFTIGEELDVFDNVQELMKKIDLYLEDDAKRSEIAANGCWKAHSHFTWKNFAENLKEITDNIKK